MFSLERRLVTGEVHCQRNYRFEREFNQTDEEKVSRPSIVLIPIYQVQICK